MEKSPTDLPQITLGSFGNGLTLELAPLPSSDTPLDPKTEREIFEDLQRAMDRQVAEAFAIPVELLASSNPYTANFSGLFAQGLIRSSTNDVIPAILPRGESVFTIQDVKRFEQHLNPPITVDYKRIP